MRLCLQYLLVVLLILTASCHRHHPGDPEVIDVEGTTSEENGSSVESSEDSEFNGPAISNPTKTVDASGTVDEDSDEYDDQDVDDSALENSEDNMRQ